MIEALQAADRWLLLALNHALGGMPGAAVWPLLTDYDKHWPVRVVLLAVWVWLLLRGGARGRTAALLVIPLIFFSDKISSAVIKEAVGRARPCHAIREAGVQTGEYHYAQQLKPDAYERLRKIPDVEPVVIKPYGWAISILNTKQGMMTNKKLRQAFQARLDIEPMMQAAMGHPDFYRLDPGLFFPEQARHSKAGNELYNQRNKEKARQLLKESGYQGQPIRWIVTREYEYHYKPALVSKSQLEEVGFNIDLQVMDWATVVQRRVKPELWDVFSPGMSFSAEATTAASCLYLTILPFKTKCNPHKLHSLH